MNYDDFRRKYDWLFSIVTDNVALNNLYERFLQRGLHYPIYDALFFHRQFNYERLHPTDSMKQYERIFLDHKEEIENNTELLADSLSKEVYQKAVRFRCTHDLNQLPPHDVTDQYFPCDIVRLSKDEVFLDCGACRGDTYRRFRRESQGQYRRIVCFETEDKNLDFISKSCKGDNRLVVVPKGVWNRETSLFFEEMGIALSGRIVEKRENTTGPVTEVRLCTIDSQECCKDATYIKMDIEGAEWEALHGAEETIRRNHPKLAICLYHLPEDYIRIIPYIHELNPNYQLYVRHHSTSFGETVLYAVDKE